MHQYAWTSNVHHRENRAISVCSVHSSPHDSVKFVVKDENDCRYARDIITSYRITGEIFFSPVFGCDYIANNTVYPGQ